MKKVPILILLAGLFAGCDKDSDTTPDPTPGPDNSLNVNMRFEVDGSLLEYDTVKYYNQAGNHYSVYTLVYYISELALVKADSSVVALKDWHYVDARASSTTHFTIDNIPQGCYTGITFNIGIDPAHNIENGLPATAENLAMEWPVTMGGGYHFLKLEGYFTDSTAYPGYAMHLGTNQCLIKVSIPASICISGTAVSKTLVMNINEWYRSPNTFDFNTDGNYIMGNGPAMLKLAQNGSDVFTIE